MLSGRDALREIDSAIARARRSVSQAGAHHQDLARRLADLDQRLADVWTEMARIRLAELPNDQSIDELGRVDQEAADLLEAHATEVENLRTEIADHETTISELEAERASQAAKTEAAILAYDEAAARTQEALQSDEAYLNALHALEEADRIAQKAEAKLAVAREDEAAKGAPYEDDPLFSYLWDRDYGTDDYRGWFLPRALDAWVAKLCNYHQYRLNYQRLKELPVRLEEHVARCHELANEAEAHVKKVESDRLAADGVTDLHAASMSSQSELEALDQAIEKAEELHLALTDQLARAATGETEPFIKAKAMVATALSRERISDLRLVTAETTSPEDDRLVSRALMLIDQRQSLEASGNDTGDTLNKLKSELARLEKVRRRFKKNRFDGPHSGFSGNLVLSALLSALINGAMSDRDFWRQVDRAHRKIRRHTDIDFGDDDWMDGFRLPGPTGPGGFGGGLPSRHRRGRTRIPAPRMPRPRPGGFRTGGGFGRRGGGGFKTGGGF